MTLTVVADEWPAAVGRLASLAPGGDMDMGAVALVGAPGGGMEAAWTPRPCTRITIDLAVQAAQALDGWRARICRAILDHAIRLWDGRPEAAETIAVCDEGRVPGPQTIVLPGDEHAGAMEAVLGPERVPDMAVLAARMWARRRALALSADKPQDGEPGSGWRVVWRQHA